MNNSMHLDGDFQLPFDDLENLDSNTGAGDYDADGSFALGEIMQQNSISRFDEPVAMMEEPVPKGFVGTMYDSLKNSVGRQNEDNQPINTQLHDNSGIAESGGGDISGQMSGHMSLYHHQSSTHFAPVFGFTTKSAA